MIKYLPLALLAIASVNAELDHTNKQMQTYKEKTAGITSTLTTTAGRSVDYQESRTTFNQKLLTNEYFVETITQLVRSVIPSRRVHRKGTGAFGYFEVTHDVTDVCKADFLSEIGKKTRVGARFTPGVDKGGKDTDRKLRTMAVKFYTEEGNLDLTCLNVPFFSMVDPILFPSFLRVNEVNPVTDMADQNMLWDYVLQNEESLYFVTYLFTDDGIPATYRHMPAFPVHTFQVVNKNGVSTFLRFHILPDAGIKNLYAEEAAELGGSDSDYYTRDLYNTIAQGEYPSWTFYIQVLGSDNGTTIDDEIFDILKEMPEDKYPLRPVGKIVLNENPVNQFAQIEQMAFNPASLVRGILGGVDRVFEGRRLAYRDAQYHRLGGNYFNIAVNCPLQKTFTYTRDGPAPVKDNMGDAPNYYPNSFNGPIPTRDNETAQLREINDVLRSNFDQLRNLYSNVMTSEARARFASNIASSLKLTVSSVQEGIINLYTSVDPNIGHSIQEALKASA